MTAMRRYLLPPLLFLFGWLLIETVLFTGCAQIVQPTGGPRDTIPPRLDSLVSTPNLQTNFEKQRIVLTFDEFLQLKDVLTQVVVSPPLQKRPKVTLHKYSTVYFDFDPEDSLRTDATYTINFGKAIQDFTEGNPAPIRFVFSTGEYIDSLKVSALVVDALTGKPVPDLLVMLYDNLADSVVRTERPFYFGITDRNGQTVIENVKGGAFKAFVLEDLNLNYLYDQAAEGIAFPDSNLTVTDSVLNFISVRFFREEPALRLDDHEEPYPGLVKLLFNREPYDLEWTPLADSLDWYEKRVADTTFVWYRQPDSIDWRLVVRQDTLLDTLHITGRSGRTALEPGLRPAEPANAASLRQPLHPARPIRLAFNHPLQTADTSLIRLLEDTLLTRIPVTAEIDSADHRVLLLRASWVEELPYELELLPGALTDLLGYANDTLRRTYKAKKRTDYGNLQFTLTQLDSTGAYVVELNFKDARLQSYQVQNEAVFTRKLTGLDPGQYSLRIIEDLNANGRWDPGNYDLRRQPERIFRQTLEEVRANWDVESTVKLEQGSAPPKQ